jgi:D-alanyl-D-alanine carboxypeptidase|nr:D-alanyl-D-alanine carboxypeptidase [Bacillota bacterium]
MRRGIFLWWVIGLLLLGMAMPPVAAAVDTEPPQVSAQAAALIDVASGRILYEKHADQRMPIASLTKIMTAIVAIERGNLDDEVVVGPNAYRKEGSSIYLELGERMRLEDLLYGLMLRSGNDAAVAIAEHVGGSVEGFAYLMNEKARELGLTGTHFTNPHGLDDGEHYSTARDLAVLTAYALKNETFRRIVSTRVHRAPWPGKPWDRVWHNKNKLLHLYEGADGVKTGYTKLARRCLVASATRDGRQLAAVVLNAPDDWNDTAALLTYGFAHFPLVELVREGDIVEEEQTAHGVVRYRALRAFTYPLAADEVEHVTSSIENGTSRFPWEPPAVLRLELSGTPIGTVPLAVERPEGDRLTFSAYWRAFWRALFEGGRL